MIRGILFFAASLACMAQYVATDDGKRLFFTSADRMAGTDQSFRSKLFSWDPEHGVRLVYEVTGRTRLLRNDHGRRFARRILRRLRG